MAKNTKKDTGADLYPRFGEFGSAEEINRAAAAQKAEGDIEAVRAIAKENGIDDMDAQDYIDDNLPELCNNFNAAIGKLDVELKALGKIPNTISLWADRIRALLMEDETHALQKGVRRKGRSFVELAARITVECSRNRQNTPQPIVDAARKLDGSIPSTLPIGDVSRKRFDEIILEYYTAPGQEEEKPEVAPVQPEKEPEEDAEEVTDEELEEAINDSDGDTGEGAEEDDGAGDEG